MAELVTGPSGGALGNGGGVVPRVALEQFPDIARRIVTIGRQPRTGHDRERWKTVRWDDYRARVPAGRESGPWRTEQIVSTGDGPSAWVEEAEGLPVCPPGLYTTLTHARRGLVMSDVPGEIAGSLRFLDLAAKISAPRLLITGLGLGILPAWLITRTAAARIDVVEIDPHVTSLVTAGAGHPGAVNGWAADPRLHVYHGDAHLWFPGPLARHGCALHAGCELPAGARWDAAFFDIWDTVSPGNLPSMCRLTRRFSRRASRVMSWERAECEAMRRRGQILPRPCFISEDGGWGLA